MRLSIFMQIRKFFKSIIRSILFRFFSRRRFINFNHRFFSINISSFGLSVHSSFLCWLCFLFLFISLLLLFVLFTFLALVLDSLLFDFFCFFHLKRLLLHIIIVGFIYVIKFLLGNRFLTIIFYFSGLFFIFLLICLLCFLFVFMNSDISLCFENVFIHLKVKSV